MGGSDAATLARLTRIEALYWSDEDLAVAEARAWLQKLGPGDHGATSRRLDLVIASVGLLRGEAGPSGEQAQRVLRWAVEHGDLAVQARCHWLLGSVFEPVGDLEMALEHAVAANDLLDESEGPLMRATARLCLADALGSAGSFDESQRRYAEAMQLISDDDTTNIRFTILNNSAYTYFLSHDLDAALTAVERLLTASTVNDQPLVLADRDTIGRVYLTAGRVADAEQILTPAMEPIGAKDSPSGAAACLITLAQVYRTQGEFGRAQEAIDRCQSLCRTDELSPWAAEAAREQAEIFAATGFYRGAFEAYQDFHARFEALVVIKREARGRLLEAAFQTAEARRESARYRGLAERDPLTGLYNRRYVDEQLSLSLMAVRDGGPALAIAMIDLDFFKRVNDLRSHEVGDDVLRAVGQILSRLAAAVPGGVAARMGGEEFLLILPGTDEGAVEACAEAVRRSIAEHDWQPITAGVAVTASIGVAVAPADGQRNSSLLGAADRRLYLAKSSGRDRVVRVEPSAVDPGGRRRS